MSENSEVQPLESEVTVPESSSEKGKTLKRNYCYVCQIQCTALKNFLDHQKGKKHLKKLQLQESQERQKQKQKSLKANLTKNNSSYRNLKSNNYQNPHEQKSKESELHGDHNSDDKGMSNSNRFNPKFKGNHYNNSNDHNNYTRNPNSRYFYNHEASQGYFSNKRPKYTYSKWGAHYSDAPETRKNFRNYEYAPDSRYYSDHRYNKRFQGEYFSGNMNDNCTPHGYENEGSCLTFSSAEPENSAYNFLENEIAESQQLESNSIGSESASKSSTKDKSDFTYISETSNSKQGSLVTSSKSSKDNKQVNLPLCSQILNSSSVKVGEKKRVRTLSLSSAESVNNDKKPKDKSESISADSESTPDEQKLKEYTTSLLETNPNRISLMIQHPSSHKEKAVLNHIMTSFSKTRRKENLTRKLRSNSIGSMGNNDDSALDIQSVSSENEEISIILPSEETCDNNLDQSKCLPSLERCENNSDEYNFDPNFSNKDSSVTDSPVIFSGNQSAGKSSKVNGKSKENNLSTSKDKTLEKRKEKSSEGVCHLKRKNSDDSTSSKTKKSKSCEERSPAVSSNKRTEQKDSSKDMSVSMNRKTEQRDVNMDKSPVVNLYSQSSDSQINPSSHNEMTPVKEEWNDSTGVVEVPNVIETPGPVSNQILDYNSQFSVETLIELFASGNVAVKKEFNDPVIDAIKGVDPNELINACSNDSHLNSVAGTSHRTTESNVISSKSPASVPNFPVQENTNCLNPVILGSTVNSDVITPVSMTKKTVIPPSPVQTETSKEQTSSTCDGPEKESLSEMEKVNLIGKVKSEFPHFITMIEELQEIACKEEKIKEHIAEAKLKINEYSSLLEEWKNKKKKLHDEEEELRKKRNDIIHSMQNTVNVPQDTDSDKNKFDFQPEDHSTPDKSKEEQKVINAKINTEMSSVSVSSNLFDVQPKTRKPNCLDSDEILILPSPMKPSPPEITIIDDTEEINQTKSNSSALPSGEITPNFPNQGSSLLDVKNLTAHSTVVNCIVVFDDFVYTCSNDYSARRFCLRDTSQTVTYIHSAKNVTEIAVEKVQNEALVFTSCSSRVLSLFIASNGTKIKTFFQSSNIRSICKGWGKFYAAMEDGTVNVYNWKYEEKEFVKTQLCPVSRIATVHQGGLHVLIILTTDGQVSLRDAKTTLLIRCIKTAIKFPAWLTVHNDFVYLSSSDRTVSVLDIQSGKVERKWQLGHNHPTGLAVCDDHFFTISYSGIICCVYKERFSDVTLYYGAGKTGLTCIHVYQNWVFTGNRKGDISVFKFDPYSRFSCKIAKCRSVFGSREDLLYHFELLHLKKKNLALCHWEKCPFIFPVNYTTNDKINHLKRHIFPMPRIFTV